MHSTVGQRDHGLTARERDHNIRTHPSNASSCRSRLTAQAYLMEEAGRILDVTCRNSPATLRPFTYFNADAWGTDGERLPSHTRGGLGFRATLLTDDNP